MTRSDDTTPTPSFPAAYEAIVALGSAPDLEEETARMRQTFVARTGAFRPEDPWFEARSRAFWDDALTTQGFAEKYAERAGLGGLGARIARAHRGLFEASTGGDGGVLLVDVWSGAELEVRPIDEAQRVDLHHADGLVDARVVAVSDAGPLHILPGAFYHPPDATEGAQKVLEAARARNLTTAVTLDALLRMEHVLRSSSRVKAAFAYRVESLPRA